MKKIIIFVLAAFMMVACDYRTEAEKEEAKRLKGCNIIVIDSCEYLKNDRENGHQGFGHFAHKGNCRFCKERRQKELEELIIKLKENN